MACWRAAGLNDWPSGGFNMPDVRPSTAGTARRKARTSTVQSDRDGNDIRWWRLISDIEKV